MSFSLSDSFKVELEEILTKYKIPIIENNYLDSLTYIIYKKGKNFKKINDNFIFDLLMSGFNVTMSDDYVIIR